ncbi:MAG: acyl carrier protein [Anaerovoracaceae bacterium]
MKETILEILADIHPDVDFENEENLIEDGVLDSFDMVTLVMELNDAFDIEIGVIHMIPENFNSVQAMVTLIESLN